MLIFLSLVNSHNDMRSNEEANMTEIIHLPGIGNSGKAHWHTLWEDADPAIRRFAPTSWDEPDCSDWVAALEKAVCAAQTPPILVAHSLACLLVAHWDQVSDLPVRGAILVAVPDPSSPAFPPQARSFADTPQRKFRFPSLIVADLAPFEIIHFEVSSGPLRGPGNEAHSFHRRKDHRHSERA
jgi:pimeloyl-ACP methyl ester carboxylesterase